MTRTAGIGLRVHPKLRDAIAELAKRDRRSVSSYVENLLMEHAIKEGVLKADDVD